MDKSDIIFYFCLAFLTIIGCNPAKNSSQKNKVVVSEKFFTVKVVQDDQVVVPENGVILLKKSPFKFKIGFIKTDNVSVSTSWGTYYYDYPLKKNIFECNDDKNLENCRFVAVKTGFGDQFNKNECIFVGDGSYQASWFYDKELDWHRFDKGSIEIENGIIYGTRTVKNIYDCDKRDERKYPQSEYDYKINKINQDIYVVMAADHYESGMENPIELQRERFVLKFK